MDERAVNDIPNLTRVLEDYLRIEESGRRDERRRERKPENEKGGKERGRESDWSITCYRCGQKGHKANQCPRDGQKVGPVKGVTYFQCGKEGHTRPNCPLKKEVKPEGKANVTGTRRAKGQDRKEVIMEGKIGELPAKFLLDSGASITIVPKPLVPDASLDGGSSYKRSAIWDSDAPEPPHCQGRAESSRNGVGGEGSCRRFETLRIPRAGAIFPRFEIC